MVFDWRFVPWQALLKDVSALSKLLVDMFQFRGKRGVRDAFIVAAETLFHSTSTSVDKSSLVPTSVLPVMLAVFRNFQTTQ